MYTIRVQMEGEYIIPWDHTFLNRTLQHSFLTNLSSPLYVSDDSGNMHWKVLIISNMLILFKDLLNTYVCMQQHASYFFHSKELKLFSGRSIRNMRKQSVRKPKMQLRQDRPNITTKEEFHKIQGHRIFDLGSELMIILFSTDFCKRKCHVCVLNMNSSYIYYY